MPWVTANIHNIFNVALRGATASPAFPAAGSLYLALGRDVSPQLDGTNFTELTTGNWSGYARQIITLGTPSGRAVANTNLINFSASASGVSGGPFNIDYGGVFPVSTVGSSVTAMLAYGKLAVRLSLINGALVQFPIGQLTITDDSLPV